MLETLYQNSSIGERVKIIRVAKGLSIRELESLSKVNKSTVSRIENNMAVLYPALIRVAEALGVSLDELTNGAPGLADRIPIP